MKVTLNLSLKNKMIKKIMGNKFMVSSKHQSQETTNSTFLVMIKQNYS